MAARWFVCLICVAALSGCFVWDTGPDTPLLVEHVTPPQRMNARSPWYPLGGEQVELLVNYCGWDESHQQRITHLEIGDKVKQMVEQADELIVATFFLFDDLYAQDAPHDYVAELADLLIAKKIEHPSMTIVLVLDSMHKGWGYRRSPVVERLVASGIDVFYSDVLETRSATRLPLWEGLNEIGRAADRSSHGILALPAAAIGRIPIPFVFDRDLLSVAALSNAALFKANHRKALVVKHHGVYEALITSWNPHNPSLEHENYAISITGPFAAYLYLVQREDIRKSIELGRSYVRWSNPSVAYRSDYLEYRLPPLPESAWRTASSDPGLCASTPRAEAALATEEAIEPLLMQWFREVEPDDRIRIQMFYLSRVPLVNAILDAAARTHHPIQILLDPGRTGINYSKDGTPNSQVAAYLLERASKENARIEIRWYVTHGEQNHAKAFTITNETTGKYLLSLGSANWTRKNLAGINLEDNIFVRHSSDLNGQFNALFDRFWSNSDPGIEYSAAWNDPRFHFDRHTGRDNWATRRCWLFLFPRFDPNGRPQLLERELVHW